MALPLCMWRNIEQKTFWFFLKAMTHLPHWPHIFLISLTPNFDFWVPPKEWELTEQGSIQMEVTLSGRRNLTSCSTHSTEDQPPVLSEHARRRLPLGFTQHNAASLTQIQLKSQICNRPGRWCVLHTVLPPPLHLTYAILIFKPFHVRH